MNRILPALLLLSLLFVSCAKDETIDNETAQDKILNSWIKFYHPDASKTESGIYILDYEQGSGAEVVDSSYVFVHYTKKSLSGEVSSSNIESVNQKVGTYALTDYYGSDIWQVGIGALPEGLEEIISGMKAGGTAKVVIPVGMSTLTNSIYNAFSNTSEDVNYVYEFTLEKVVEDILGYEIEQLEAYRDKKYPGVDSTVYGFYFKKLVEAAAEDTVTDETTLKVWYIGKRLDGTVFDTNIEDSAKFYRLYSSDNDYEGLEVTFYKDMEESVSNNETVAGFSMAISQLKYGEEIITFFSSDLGYGTSGSSTSIGENSPLMFYIKLDPDD